MGMKDALLDIKQVAETYRTTPGAIRTALWKHRKRGASLPFPKPLPRYAELRWLKSAIDAHLADLKQEWLNSLQEPVPSEEAKNVAPSAAPARKPAAGRKRR